MTGTAVLTKPDELLTRISERTEQLQERGQKLDDLRRLDAGKRSDGWAADITSTAREVTILDSQLTADMTALRAQLLIDETRAALEAREHGAGPLAATAGRPGPEYRTAGQLVVASDEYKRRNTRYMEGVNVRALLSSETSDPAAGTLLPQGQPIPPTPRQLTLRIRDLLTVQPTGLSSIPYVRELNPLANELGATGVAEGGLKPEATMQFQGADAPVRKIAAWVPVTREIVDDVDTLRGYIDTRLAYMTDRAEDQQLLNGNGVSPYILGIRQTSDLQSQTVVNTGGSGSSADPAATLGRAIGKIELVDLDPDGIVMHPTDYWAMVSTRHANQFDGGFGDGNRPFGPPDRSVHGLPVIRTRAMTQGKALVGSWRLAATLFDRMETTIFMTDSHSDYFIYNKLVILAERREALAIHRPDGFCEATIA